MFNFATVNLDGSKKISTHAESGQLVLETSIVDAYASLDASLDLSTSTTFLRITLLSAANSVND